MTAALSSTHVRCTCTRHDRALDHLAHVGHRGDGVADIAGGPVYVPYTLPGETVEAEPVTGHPDRRQLLRVEAASARADRADLPAFRRLRRLRDPALAHRALSRLEARAGRRRAGAGRHRRAVDDLIDAHGDGPAPRGRSACAARRAGHPARSASRRRAPITSCRSTAARAGAALARRDRGRLERSRKRWQPCASRSISRSLRPMPASTSTCAAPARSMPPHGKPSPVRRRDPARLARLTRHGELVAQISAADRAHGPRRGRAAARRFPAGDRGRRGRRWRGSCCDMPDRREVRRRPVLRRRPVRACGSPNAPASPRSTATRPRSRRCSRRPPRRPA